MNLEYPVEANKKSQDFDSYGLFLGFKVEDSFAAEISKLDQKYVDLYVKTDEAYLQWITYEKIRYLGKPIGKKTDVKTLELLEKNIYSLLKKLVPSYHYSSLPLSLFVTSLI